jgi:hypothetical protein
MRLDEKERSEGQRDALVGLRLSKRDWLRDDDTRDVSHQNMP